jgi:hypothetical protein
MKQHVYIRVHTRLSHENMTCLQADLQSSSDVDSRADEIVHRVLFCACLCTAITYTDREGRERQNEEVACLYV